MRRVREHGWLFVGSAALALIESVLVITLAPQGAGALAPQVVAPPPFGVFHDLRWVLVYQPSWWALVLVVLAFLAFRTTVDIALVRSAWPRDVAMPPVRDHARRVLRFTALQALVLVLFAVLTFAMAVTSLSWLFFVATPVLLMVALLVHHGDVLPTWWRDRPTRTTIASTLLIFATLTLAGAAISSLPGVAVPFVAVGAALAVARFRLQTIHALAPRTVAVDDPASTEPQARRRPFAVIGLAVVLAIVLGGTAIGFAVAVAVESGRTPPPRAAADATGSPVLVVKGFNSRWDGVTYRWVRGDHLIRRFSYRGLDARDRPQPYERDDTHRSLEQLARQMRAQVAAIREQTGEPVSIVAESEGALVTQVYLAAFPRAPVESVVLLSPLAEPGRVFYPPEGEEGWGVGTGVFMRVLAEVIAALGPVDVSADAPLFRSITDLGPTVGALLACPPPGVRSYAVLPLDEAVAAPAPVDVGYDHQTVGSFHGGLLGDDSTQDAITAVLDGEEPDEGSAFWGAASDVLGAVAAPWQVPGLAPGLEPAWDGLPDSDDCAAVRDELRSVVSRVSRTGSG